MRGFRCCVGAAQAIADEYGAPTCGAGDGWWYFALSLLDMVTWQHGLGL
jgi:hypothetical protein